MIRVQKWKITPSQAGIFLWTGALVMGVILVVFFVFVPWQKNFETKQHELLWMEARLQWLAALLADARDPEKVLAILERTKQTLARKFPDSETRSLAMISDYANKFRVQMAQVRPEARQIFRDSRGMPVRVDQKTCSFVPVTLTFRSDYKNWMKYCEILHQAVPAYLSVERLEFEKDTGASPALAGNAEIALFLLE